MKKASSGADGIRLWSQMSPGYKKLVPSRATHLERISLGRPSEPRKRSGSLVYVINRSHRDLMRERNKNVFAARLSSQFPFHVTTELLGPRSSVLGSHAGRQAGRVQERAEREPSAAASVANNFYRYHLARLHYTQARHGCLTI